MFPGIDGFHWTVGHIVFLSVFFAVVLTIGATVVSAAWRPFAVEHANPIDALFVRDQLHDPVSSLAVVIQHGVPGGTGYAARQLVGAQDHRVDELLFLRTEVEITADAADAHNQNGERQNQLGAKFSKHSGTLSLPDEGKQRHGEEGRAPPDKKLIWLRMRLCDRHRPNT